MPAVAQNTHTIDERSLTSRIFRESFNKNKDKNYFLDVENTSIYIGIHRRLVKMYKLSIL